MSKELAASGQLSAEQITEFRVFLKSPACPLPYKHQFVDTLCDMALSSLRSEPDKYLMGICTESNCRLCRTPQYERKTGMYHAGLSAYEHDWLDKSVDEQPMPLHPAEPGLSAETIKAVRKHWDNCSDVVALCDMALRSLTAPTNTPNGDRQELIDKCLDAGRDEGIEAAAKILHEPWASAVRALAQGQKESGQAIWSTVDLSKASTCPPDNRNRQGQRSEAERIAGSQSNSNTQSSDHPTDRYETLGYALAMRIMQSGMYDRLDDKERAECDELIRIGMAAPSREDCKPKEQK